MVAIFGGSHPDIKKSTELNNQINSKSVENTQNSNEKYSVADKVTESGVVANLAESADLAIASSVASLSTSTAILQDSPQAAASVEKPKFLRFLLKNVKSLNTLRLQKRLSKRLLINMASLLKLLNGLMA